MFSKIVFSIHPLINIVEYSCTSDTKIGHAILVCNRSFSFLSYFLNTSANTQYLKQHGMVMGG